MSFEELLLEAIDEGLSPLGESVKQVVYSSLETNFKIKKHDIPYKIEEFTDAIDRIFGDGAKILEIKIMKDLFKKMGHTYKKYSKHRDLKFIESTTAAKLETKNFGKRKENQEKTDHMQKGEKKIMCIRTS